MGLNKHKKEILLSKGKIKELKKELKGIKKQVLKHYEAEHETILASMREAASFDVTIKVKQSRLNTLKNILKNVKVLPSKIDSDKVILGSWIELRDENDKIIKYRIVHPLEADPKRSLLSVESPLGTLLLNKEVNSIVNLNEREYRIVSIE